VSGRLHLRDLAYADLFLLDREEVHRVDIRVLGGGDAAARVALLTWTVLRVAVDRLGQVEGQCELADVSRSAKR